MFPFSKKITDVLRLYVELELSQNGLQLTTGMWALISGQVNYCIGCTYETCLKEIVNKTSGSN